MEIEINSKEFHRVSNKPHCKEKNQETNNSKLHEENSLSDDRNLPDFYYLL